MQHTDSTRQFIAYYRVSTMKQGRSGLGLEAQQALVGHYVSGNGKLTASYTEVESGKRNDRSELAKAIAHATRARATLVIAKIDRLARNVAFISALMESAVDFVAADNPNANRLTVHILAAVAEDEARQISERTKAALGAYKLRGGLLGSLHPKCKKLSAEAARKGHDRGCARNRDLAKAAYVDLVPLIREMREAGQSFRQISASLNTLGHETRTGKAWGPCQVHRILTRANASS